MTMRLIQRQLQNPLAKMLLAGTIKDGDTVEVSVRDGQLTLNGGKFAEAA
jgi:ATP-dependent Clp protease ATP-binding subunit ClpB